jgi:hypothetical protein
MLFGGFAAALAAVGSYGVIAYLSRLRTRKIGIRIALGAAPAEMRARVLVSGAPHDAIGAAVGGSTGLILSRAGSARVPGLGDVDPWTVVWLAIAAVIDASARPRGPRGRRRGSIRSSHSAPSERQHRTSPEWRMLDAEFAFNPEAGGRCATRQSM